MMPPAPSAAPDLPINRNLLTSTVALIKDIKADKRLWSGGLITAWFWLVGAVMVALLPPLINKVIGGTENVYIVALARLHGRHRDRLGHRRTRQPHAAQPRHGAARCAC